MQVTFLTNKDREELEEQIRNNTPEAGATNWDELEGKPESFPPSSHSHKYEELEDKPEEFADLVVTFEYSGASGYTTDKTYDEISEAIQSGKTVLGKYSYHTLFPIISIIDGSIVFCSSNPYSNREAFTIYPGDSITYSSYNPINHTHSASKIYDGTFIGTVKAGSSYQSTSTYLLRNSKISASEENPTVNGEICWVRK